MNLQIAWPRYDAPYARLWSIVLAAGSMVRGLPLLLLLARPKTPLRVLCIMAFDTLQRLRQGKPLATVRIRTIAALLDFGACANAALDHKDFNRREYRQTRRLLEEAGIRPCLVEYLQRLRELERSRPMPGTHDWQFPKAVWYREAVVRLSLGMVAATADGEASLEEGIRATYAQADLNLLFRIVMECQIIDDVLDYAADRSGGLPSFLTASRSLAEGLEQTRLAALGYADDRDVRRVGELFVLRWALFVVAELTKVVLMIRRSKLFPRAEARG